MTQPQRELGRHKDIPRVVELNFASAAAGSGSDYEHPLYMVPDLTAGAPAGTAGLAPNNWMRVRNVLLTVEAAITGAATNNFTWNINHYRSGSLLVNTTLSSAITAGAGVTITPVAGVANIIPGMMLQIQGTGQENVMVLSVNSSAGTFTANVQNNHSGGVALVSLPIASITFASGTNLARFATMQLSGLLGEVIRPGDVITLARVSNGTGLASPAGLVILDMVPATFY